MILRDKSNILYVDEHIVQGSLQRTIEAFTYAVILFFYLLVGIIAGHPYDDAIYAQHAQFFYYLSLNPTYGLLMGAYYSFINIGGYFVTILLSLLGVSNVLTIQIGVKVPFILFTFLTALVLYKLVKNLGFDGRYASLIFLTSPIYFFTSVVYGSAIVVSMFFLVSSIYLLFRKRNLLSAILFGIAAGSYLYPLFSIPFLLRYVKKESGWKETAIYFAVSVLFAAIGQLTVLIFYYFNGYHSIAVSAPSSYVSIMPLPYYSVFDILSIFGLSSSLPGQIYDDVYYASAIIASLSYFLIKRDNVNKESLLVFFLIQGVLFSAINPYNLPSYMSAMIPFAIILAIIYRRWLLIGLLWLVSVLSLIVMQTINHIGFPIYFSDVNMKLLNINVSYPSWLNYVAGFLYSLCLLTFIPIGLRIKAGKVIRFRNTIASQLSTLVAMSVVAIVVLAPVASSVPGDMFLAPSLDHFYAQPVSASLSGSSLIVDYVASTPGLVGGSYSGDFIGYIEMPSSTYVVFNTSGNTKVSPGDYEENISLPYPLQNATLELFGAGKGTSTVVLVNGTETVQPSYQTVTSGSFIFRYLFNTTLGGTYSLDIVSDVSLRSQNHAQPSIVLSGYPFMGRAMIGRYYLTGGFIPGNLLKSKISVEYSGPFKNVPPSVPSILIYLAKKLVSPLFNSIVEGGILFVLLIAVPASLALFFVRRGSTHRR